RVAGRGPVDVRLGGAVVAALDGVVEEPLDAVAVVLVVLRRVDATLGGDAVGPAGGVVEGEHLHPVAQLAQRGGRGRARQTGSHHDHLQAPAGRRGDELPGGAVGGPLVFEKAPRGLCAHVTAHGPPSSLAHLTRPTCTPIGTLMTPPVTTTANATAKYRRQTLNRGLFHPTLWKRLQAPWNRWMPSATHAAMYTSATGTRWKLATVFRYTSPRTYPGLAAPQVRSRMWYTRNRPTMMPVYRMVRDAKFAAT